jgi:CheY-like chemotaxis protein
MNKSKRIFLIEDDEHDRYFFTLALKSIAHAELTDSAENGKEAIDKLLRAAILPDIIFTDIQMPLMDGVDFIHAALQRIPGISLIPIVAMSNELSRINKIKEVGARAFIKKPGTIATLADLVERMVHLDYTKDADIANQTFNSIN